MGIMILKMTGVTLLYVAITAGLWYFWNKKPNRGTGAKLLIGLIFGACSVAANHFGIVYENSILNVRDIGPLAAGLLFSPLSGIVSGLIGGVERYLIGEYLGIGSFTRVACGMSTVLAGLLSAMLHRWLYREKKPAAPFAFFLGAVMEVFHMYAILITNRDDLYTAYSVVKLIAAPMILFTALGTALCAFAVLKLSGSRSISFLKPQWEDTPIAVLFQRRLMIVTIALFVVTMSMNYNLATQTAEFSAANTLILMDYENMAVFDAGGSIDDLRDHLEEQNYSNGGYVALIDAVDGRVLADSTLLLGTYMPMDDLETLTLKEEAHEDHLFYCQLLSLGDEILCHTSHPSERYWLLCFDYTTSIYTERENQMLENTLSNILVFTVLYLLINLLVDGLVVRNLGRVNKSLNRITGGNLNEEVWVRTSSEFSALSDDINKTVTALRGYISAAEKRMEEELKLAADIQDSALPKNFSLPTDSIELYALMTPAKHVGGDFYDFFFIDKDTLCLVIADVSGKGVPASLFMMRAKTAIKNYAALGSRPSALLASVNNTLCDGNDMGMFVTVWIGILDLNTGVMQCANAGHEYPVLMRAGGEYELFRDKHGLVLAAMEDIPMKDYEIPLNPGDKLFVYTDGVPEAINEKEEAYGTRRLTDRLNVLKNRSQERILTGTLQDIRNFAGKAEQFDDITMLGLTFLGHAQRQSPEE